MMSNQSYFSCENTMTDDITLGNEAKHLLDNKLFKGAFGAVAGYLEQKTLTCDPDNKDQAQRIVISKQLLYAVKREIERQVETGMIAEVQMSEFEQKQSLLKRVFKR